MMSIRRAALWTAFLAGVLSVAPAAAQEFPIELEWTVDEDGSTLVRPRAKGEPEGSGRWGPWPLFEPRAGGLRTLVSGGILGWLPFMFPGRVDLASHCDIAHHFRRLGLSLTDEALIERIATPPEKLAEGEPLLRRARLDRLLAVRLAGERRITGAREALLGIHRDPASEPFLRDAAWESLAALGDPPLPYPERRLPPLLTTLAGIPSSADVVVVVNQSRIPRWMGLAAAARAFGLRQARTEIERLGAAVTPRDLATGLASLDAAGEAPYELARRFGNLRIDRTVAAVDLDAGPAVRLRMDGRFHPSRIREAFEREGLEVEHTARLTIVRIPEEGAILEVSPDHFLVSIGEWPSPEGGSLLATELGLAGATRGHAVWVHLRHPVPGRLEPPLAGLTRATLAMDFAKGIRWRVSAEYVHDAAARVAARAVRDALGQAPPPLQTADIDAELNGPALTMVLALPGLSPEEALLRLMRVR
jgi:hypothetical protein